MNRHRNQIIRAVMMLTGLLISAFGVSLSIKAKIGTSPIACCPAVYSAALHITVGTAMWMMCVLFILAQIMIAKKDFHPFQLFQIIVVVLFGKLTDATTSLLSSVDAQSVLEQGVFCILGILFLAFGVFLLLKANLLMLSPDALLALVSKKYGVEYGKAKVVMDVSMVLIAAIGSVILYGKLIHVGIGTLAAALFVGMVIRFLKRVEPLNALLDRIVGLQ